ncbi:MAG TPA: UPF0182 family protein [Propionicimonas sp.]|nr:UPF0182 family protein [Propionicimonas sp.]HQA77471.1 UPF0182 family protein [Propionicimonas sp.]HQD95861.1 UPF0182 family protein [Propionicimonas sp.]
MNVASQAVRRSPLLPTIAVVGVLVTGFIIFAELWTRKLWFDSVAFPQVFTTQLLAQVLLFAIFFVVMALSVGLNMWIAFRLRPETRRTGQSAVLDRYRDLLEANIWVAILVPSVFLGLIAGTSVLSQSMEYLAWWNRTPFGTTDPYFGMDIGFYVFEYPILRDLLAFIMSALFFGLVAAAVVHFAVGGIVGGRDRGQSGRGNAARIHLSILGGLLLVGYGLQTLLDRYGLLLQPDALFTGIQYTDAHSRFNAKLVLAIIAFVCAALFFANGFLKRWTLPITALVLLLVSSLILSVAYPMIMQGFQVKPNEPDFERPYIQAHLEATRTAYDIADTEVEEYEAVTQVSKGQLKEDAEALPGIRLIDPAVVPRTFENQQQLRGYYTFPEVLDVDRYVIDGKETDAVVAAREINIAGLPDQAWNNLHTVYTHGYGMVAAYGNQRSAAGEPVWIEKNLPPEGVLPDYEGRIYFGEKSTTFAIVGRLPGQAPIEFDSPGGGQGAGEVNNVYAGTGGVPIGDLFTRVLYAAHFADWNFLLSDRVNAASKILYNRTPKERVAEVAPWLTLDSNVYPAVVDGRLVWIVDAYTTTANYPNSQLTSLRAATTDSQSDAVGTQVEGQVNYLRNSVKAVVDASNGTVDLYAWEAEDPILQSYMKAFPGTVKAKADISTDLMAHLRYPEDLFKVQRQLLTRYHMTDPNSWYQQSDLWQVPADPTLTTPGQSAETARSGPAEPPYYLSIKWPGDASPVFSQTGVFVPNGRANLASYISVVAEASSPDYGRMRVLRMSDTHQIAGPSQTLTAMTTDQKFAEVMRPYLNQGSAAAQYGNLLTLPMGSGLLYVMPIYTIRESGSGSGTYPALQYVAVRFGEHVGIGSTLQAALDQVFSGDAGADTGENPVPENPNNPTEPTTPAEPTEVTPADQKAATEAMQAAETAFTAAEAALRNGDLAEYQKQVTAAKEAVATALEKLGQR